MHPPHLTTHFPYLFYTIRSTWVYVYLSVSFLVRLHQHSLHVLSIFSVIFFVTGATFTDPLTWRTRLACRWSRVRFPDREHGMLSGVTTRSQHYRVCISVSFGGDTKRRRSLLSGVYARGSKISHTWGKCVTCCGLHILT